MIDLSLFTSLAKVYKFIYMIPQEKAETAALAVQVCASLLSFERKRNRSLTYCTNLQANKGKHILLSTIF